MNSHKTAISRSKPSRPLQDALEMGAIQGRVLDFGCGKGRDLEELQRLGYKARGYDPHFMPSKPRGRFQTVLMTYVLNVLKTPERTVAINNAWEYVKPGGRLIVTVRSEREICEAAAKGSWKKVNWGYETSKGTFQRGYTQHQLTRALYGLNARNIAHYTAGGVMAILLKY